MNINDFRHRADDLLTFDASKQQGYNSVKSFSASFKKFIQSDSIESWLCSGHYDLVHTAESFFVRVAQSSGFNQIEIDKALQAAAELKAEQDKFKDSYIFVDTVFKRTSQSILLLGSMENQRRLRLFGHNNLLFKDDAALHSELARMVQAHYRANDGTLKVWGNIQHYRLYHQHQVMTFDVEGRLLQSWRRALQNSG